MLASLGLFVFNLSTIPYQNLALKSAWRHPTTSRVGDIPATQYTGRDGDDITVSGTLHPEITGGIGTIAFLKAMADTGGGWPYLRGDGEYLGMFVIKSIDQNESFLQENGTPKQIDFSMTLGQTDEDNVGDLGAAILAWL